MNVEDNAKKIIDAKAQGDAQVKEQMQIFIDQLLKHSAGKMAGGGLETCKQAMEEADKTWRLVADKANEQSVGMNPNAFQDMTRALNPAIAEQMNWA